MREYIVARVGKPSLKFSGELVGELDTKQGTRNRPAGDSKNYSVRRLYRTAGGKYVGEYLEILRSSGQIVRALGQVFDKPDDMYGFYNSSQATRYLLEKAGLESYEVIE